MTRWHGDTSFATFCLARGQAGTFSLFFPACPRESKSSEITVISVTLSPRSGYFRIKTQRLTVQKSVTYDAKVRDLCSVIHWLTDNRTKKIYEKVWATMSKYEQLWIAPSPFSYLCNVVQRYQALSISKSLAKIFDVEQALQSASGPPLLASDSKAVTSSRPCWKRGLVKKVEPS